MKTYLMIGNPETTGVARVFVGESALECAQKALSALPKCVVETGVFLGPVCEDKADSLAWSLISQSV